MLTSFDSVCSPSSPALVFGQIQYSTLLEVQPKHFLTPTFLLKLFFCILSFNLHFDLVINSDLHLFLFFHKTFYSHSISHCKCLFDFIVKLKRRSDMKNT